MNKAMGEQLSAFVDDELRVREEALLVSRLCADDECRQVVYRYALMSSAMRSQKGDLLGAVLADRIRGEVDKESTHHQPAYARASGLLKPVAGLAVAAGVAAVAVLNLSQNGIDAPALIPNQDAAMTMPGNTVVPASQTGSAEPLSQPVRLTNYMIKHSDYSPALTRRSVLSEIIGQEGKFVGQQDAPTDDPEAEEALQ